MTVRDPRSIGMKRRLIFDLLILSLFMSAIAAGAILYFSMKDYALKTADADAQRMTDIDR